MKNLSKSVVLFFGVSLFLNCVAFADDPKNDATAAAIDRNTKAVEANTKAVQDAAAAGNSSTVKTVGEAAGKAGVAWVIFKIGDGILKAVTKGPGMFIIIPTNILKQMSNPGGSNDEAFNICDEPALKHLDGTGNGMIPPQSQVSKSVAI